MALRIAFDVVRRSPMSLVVLLTLASQGTAAASIFALPLLGLGVSDAYSIGIQVGTGAFSGIVMGVVYLLAIGRPGFTAWRACGIGACLFGITVSIVCASLYGAGIIKTRIPTEDIYVLTALFCVGGLALSLSSIDAVREACLGHPGYLSAVTIPGNAAMFLTTLVAALVTGGWKEGQPVKVFVLVAPALAWALANVAVAVFVHVRRRQNAAKDSEAKHQSVVQDSSAVDTSRGLGLHTFALALGSITSSVFPVLFLSAASALPHGAITLLFIANRIGGASVGLFVNSFLLVKYNWSSVGHRDGPLPVLFTLAGGVMALAAVLLEKTFGLHFASQAIIIVSWLLFLVAGPLVLRRVNAARRGDVIFTKVLIDLAVSSVICWYLYQAPSVTGFFGAYIMSQVVTLAVCSLAYKQRGLTIAAAATTPLALIMLLYGW